MPEYMGGGGEKFCSRDSRCECIVQGGKYPQTCGMPKNSALVCNFPWFSAYRLLELYQRYVHPLL